MQETAKARQAWADYLALGPDRSLARLADLRRDARRKHGESTRAVLLRQLQKWSAAFDWQGRLRAIADAEAAAGEAEQAAYVRSIIETGFGLAHERVAVLKRLADTLLGDVESDRRWLKDYRGVGRGDDFALLTIERFNAAEVEQLRGLLDDIAKETGGRTTKTAATVTHEGTVAHAHSVELAGLSDDDLATLERILGAAAEH